MQTPVHDAPAAPYDLFHCRKDIGFRLPTGRIPVATRPISHEAGHVVGLVHRHLPLLRAAHRAGIATACRGADAGPLASGARYWIVLQYQSLDGLWVTVPVVAGALLSNPVAFAAR